MFDSVDKKLIALLQENARMSYTELSRAVHLSRPSVVERINRYLEKGIIEKFTAVVSLKKIGRPVSMFIQISNINLSVGEILEALDREEILEIYAVTGVNNFILKAATRDLEEMQELLKELMQYGNVVTSLIISNYSAQRDVIPL